MLTPDCDRGSAEEGTQTICEICADTIHSDRASDAGWTTCESCGMQVCRNCADHYLNSGMCEPCLKHFEENYE